MILTHVLSFVVDDMHLLYFLFIFAKTLLYLYGIGSQRSTPSSAFVIASKLDVFLPFLN